jgi:hypothetical protein
MTTDLENHRKRSLWLVAVADKGIVAFVHACGDEQSAVNGLARHLRKHNGYKGPNDWNNLKTWLDEHEDYLDIRIVRQALPAVCLSKPPLT